MLPTIFLGVSLLLARLADAHIAAWHPAMYCFNVSCIRSLINLTDYGRRVPLDNPTITQTMQFSPSLISAKLTTGFITLTRYPLSNRSIANMLTFRSVMNFLLLLVNFSNCMPSLAYSDVLNFDSPFTGPPAGHLLSSLPITRA